MKHKDEIYDGLVREYKEVVADLVASSAELKRIGQDFIEFGKDIINSRRALSFDKESIDLDVSRVMDLIQKHEELYFLSPRKLASGSRTVSVRESRQDLSDLGRGPEFFRARRHLAGIN